MREEKRKMETQRTYYRIVRPLALIQDKKHRQLRLNLISWNGEAPVYDLRIWNDYFPQGWQPGKGIMFSAAEAKVICDAILNDLLLSAAPKEPEEGTQKAENDVLTECAANLAGD